MVHQLRVGQNARDPAQQAAVLVRKQQQQQQQGIRRKSAFKRSRRCFPASSALTGELRVFRLWCRTAARGFLPPSCVFRAADGCKS